MDIRPPVRKPVPRPIETLPPPVTTPPVDQPTETPEPPLRRRRAALWVSILTGLLALILLACGGWYAWSLTPVDPNDPQQIRFVINPGDGSADIASNLESHGLIRSSLAFRIYNEFSGTKGELQAGGFALSPAQSLSDIVNHLVQGKTDEMSVIVLPGLTLKQLADPEIRSSLAWQGFSEQEIKDAFADNYEHPLLAGRPREATLEGYVFPETYRVNASDSLSTVLKMSFDEVYERLQKDGLVEKFKAQGLNLYQAMTLASIVGKEVSDPKDQRQVAQVFLRRLKLDMPLGSDPTFIYAADQLGVEPTINIDSPYNTRRYGGLPPGPIANMNYSALQAVANPAPGDYLYFVSGDGDDAGKTFFSRTEEEHHANIEAHCHEICR